MVVVVVVVVVVLQGQSRALRRSPPPSSVERRASRLGSRPVSVPVPSRVFSPVPHSAPSRLQHASRPALAVRGARTAWYGQSPAAQK